MSDLTGQGTRDAYAAAMHMADQDKDKALGILAREVAEWQDKETDEHPGILDDCTPSECPLIESNYCETITTCIYKREYDR
jgi:hypothetical protein